jgi:hypothetical protein
VHHLDWLGTYRDQVQHDWTRYRAREVRWSRVRLVLFLALIALVVVLRHEASLAATGGILVLVVFVGAVRRHAKWLGQRAFAEWTLIVIQECLHACTRRDRPARFWPRPQDPEDPSALLPPATDSGPTWPLTEQERDDLDLYGPPVGLFGLLNRTSTPLGARRLRDMLDRPCLSREHIERRQHAVRWLAAHNEYCLGLMASLVPLRDPGEDLDTVVRLLSVTPDPPRSVLLTAVRLWSAVSGVIFVAAAVHIGAGDYAWVQVMILLALANLVILSPLRPLLRRLRAAVAPWVGLSSALRRFLTAAQYGSSGLPEMETLGFLQGHLRRVVTDTRLPSLCAWLDWASPQGMARAILNLVVFLDLHIATAVLSRIAPYRDILRHGLSAVAELEALASLACFSAEQPVACYPRVEKTGLSLAEGRHPLLLAPDVTPNSAELTSESRTWVITGPNAAGKSTFLRMVGINVLLAQTGAAVPARAMTWSPMRLITDVRIRDDLARNESYFLSEVRRLRRLVLDLDDTVPIFGLIDEPFRGTNSRERVAAGIALLEHLMASPHFLLIATHEDLLAHVAGTTTSARNYHFQEHLQEQGVAFDYLLRPGPATTHTALRILEREGYPTSLLERARRLLDGAQDAPAG